MSEQKINKFDRTIWLVPAGKLFALQENNNISWKDLFQEKLIVSSIIGHLQ